MWTYGARAGRLGSFYCTHISGVQRLPNGNTLITMGPQGILSEVTRGGEEVWRYVSPVVHFEEGFPRDAVDFVEMAGYRVVRNVSGHARKMFGRGQCVVETAGECRRCRVLWAGSDGRGDGCAAGY